VNIKLPNEYFHGLFFPPLHVPLQSPTSASLVNASTPASRVGTIMSLGIAGLTKSTMVLYGFAGLGADEQCLKPKQCKIMQIQCDTSGL